MHIVESIVHVLWYINLIEIEPNPSQYKNQAKIAWLDIRRVTNGSNKWIYPLVKDLPTHFGAY